MENNLCNLDAEQAVLGAIFVDNTIFAELSLQPECFYRESHKVLYMVMAEIYCSDRVIDMITVSERLKAMNKLDAIGGIEYIMYLYNRTITTVGVEAHADIVQELYIKRQLLRFVEETKLDITANDYDSNELISSLQQKVDNLVVNDTKSNDVIDIANNLGLAVSELKRMAEAKESGLATGFLDFDKATGGLFGSDLNILAARPGMGKTALALNIAQYVVYKRKGTVLFVSLEMSRQQLQHRLLSSLTGVELTKFRTPTEITPDEWKRLETAKRYVSEGFLEVCAGLQLTVEDIRHRARKCQHEHGLDLVIVDYLQLIVDKDSKGDRVREVTKISRGLKAMAMELNVPVIALSQLNRGLESRNDKRPLLSDLRESGSIEQDADIVLFVYRDNYYNPESENKHTELIVAKNRHGARTIIPLFFNAKTATFVNLCRDRG